MKIEDRRCTKLQRFTYLESIRGLLLDTAKVQLCKRFILHILVQAETSLSDTNRRNKRPDETIHPNQ